MANNNPPNNAEINQRKGPVETPDQKETSANKAGSQVKAEAINTGVSGAKILLYAGLSLLLAAAAVLLFSVLQTAVPCIFQPVTYAIFVGIVLASIGAILGGSAGIRGNLDKLGIRWAVGGGAALLLIVMGGVYWLTRSDCSIPPNIKFSTIPSEFVTANDQPLQRRIHLRVRFDDAVTLRQYHAQDFGYLFFLRPQQRKVVIFVDMIQDNRSVEVCQIIVSKASDRQIDSGLLGRKDIILVDRESEEPFELRFRRNFIEDTLAKYDFHKQFSGPANACIEVDYFDESNQKRKPTVVTEIFLVEPGLVERVEGIRWLDLSTLRTDFKIYAIKPPQQPTDAVEKRPEPATTVQLTTSPKPGDACSTSPRSSTMSAFEALKQGAIGDTDLKTLYEGWCEVEEQFYSLLRTSQDPNLKYRLARFVRTSITAVDTCWASNEEFRRRNADRVTRCVNPKLNEPRNLARPLPFAEKVAQKGALFLLLLEEVPTARREVEFLMRAYPHDDFNRLFEAQFQSIDDQSSEEQQIIALAAVGYYYNRIVEQSWSNSVELAGRATHELLSGQRWAEKLAGVDRAASRARLYYARAYVYGQVTSGKVRPVDVELQMKLDYGELLRLTLEEMLAYPFPHHLARSHAYVNGKPDEFKKFEALDPDRFERVPGRPSNIDGGVYEGPLFLRVIPDLEATGTHQIRLGQRIKVLMQFDTDPKRTGKIIWDFVATDVGVGWLRRQGKSS